MDRAALYRTVWRWHFYAGLFVVPMILILSLTGAVYLFKPQVERWEERAFHTLPVTGAVSADRQRDAAIAAFPGSQFLSYRLPERAGDASLIHLALPGNGGMRDVFVSPRGKVIGALDPQWRVMQVAHDIHGQLMLGPRGSWLVELAASWAIVMIASGLYLWWPRGRAIRGVLWPRLRSGKRVFWRDLHAVTGFWVSGLALVLLITGLPWADVWGSGFRAVRSEMGWTKGAQDWTIGGLPAEAEEHAAHDHGAMMAMAGMDGQEQEAKDVSRVTLDDIVRRAAARHLPFPVIVSPPGGGAGEWTVKSDTQNRPQRMTLRYDATTGREIDSETFADKHVIDRVIGYGVAWHEGQLFGLFNQIVGVATALMLCTLAVSGFVLWRRRKPQAGLGAPPPAGTPARAGGVALILLLLALLLPMLAMSLAGLWLVERLILTRITPVSRWLGLTAI